MTEKLFGDFCRQYFKDRLLTRIGMICAEDYNLTGDQIERTLKAIWIAMDRHPEPIDILVGSWGERLYPLITMILEEEINAAVQGNEGFIREHIRNLWNV